MVTDVCAKSNCNQLRIDKVLSSDWCLSKTQQTHRYCADSVPAITDIFAEAGRSLFRRIPNNESHVLHQLLPEKTNCTYNLRSRQHNRQLTRKSTHINDSLFFIRMLYKDAYWGFMVSIFLLFCRNFCFRLVFRCVLSTSYIRIYGYIIYGWKPVDKVIE